MDGLPGRLHDHPQLLRPDGFIGNWVGFDNYKTLFTTSTLVTAIKNNAIWVAVVPAFVTAIGLIFAVLTERVRWAVVFKTFVFLPMAISAFATGVTWRIMYQQDPDLGAVNAVGKAISGVFNPAGVLSSATPSTPRSRDDAERCARAQDAGRIPAASSLLGLTGIPPDQVPSGAVQAVTPAGEAGRRRRDASGATSSPAAGRPAWSRSRRSACPA